MIHTFINLIYSAKVEKHTSSFPALSVCPPQGPLTPEEKTRVNAETGVFSIRLGLKYAFRLFMQCCVSVNTASNTAQSKKDLLYSKVCPFLNAVCCNVQSNWSFLNKRLADFFNPGRIILSLALILQSAQTIQHIVNEVLSKSLIIDNCIKVFNFFTHSHLGFCCKTL